MTARRLNLSTPNFLSQNITDTFVSALVSVLYDGFVHTVTLFLIENGYQAKHFVLRTACGLS